MFECALINAQQARSWRKELAIVTQSSDCPSVMPVTLLTGEAMFLRQLLEAAEQAWLEKGPGAQSLDSGSVSDVYNRFQDECSNLLTKLGGIPYWRKGISHDS